MAEIKGTKTEKNLNAAFAGESQARVKYQFYASKAKEVFVEHTTTIETLVVIHFPEFLCHQCHAGVVESLFHGDADALILKSLRQVTVLLPNLKR